MERVKVSKDVLVEEARFILANVLAEGRYGRQNRLVDIRRICDGAVSIPFADYIGFLEQAGYLIHDRANDTLDVTEEGERVVTGERVEELMERAVSHFKSGGAAAGVRRAPGPGQVARQAMAPAKSAPHTVPRETRDLGPRYEKVKEIGSGGIGTVYVAKQVPLSRKVALKEIRELYNFFGDDQRREINRRFGDVVQAAAQLSHPNIVPIHDAAIDREYPFVVTELMPQGSVRRLIADAEEIPVTLSVKYLLQVLHALLAAHGAGVAHRGLKPENLLIDAHGNVKVSDFGFTRIVERDQAVIRQVYVGMGSVAYMAPELFTDPLGAGPQSDIYALGIIFYEMLTRKLPGRRSPLPSKIDSSVPKGIDDIFDKMTRDEPDERYPGIEPILEDFSRVEGLSQFLEGEKGMLLVENPIEKLKFKEPEKEEKPKSTPAKVDAKGDDKGDDAGGDETKSVKTDDAPSKKTRASSRRTFSTYQQRLNKGRKSE